MIFRSPGLALILCLLSSVSAADLLTIAVASNFAAPAAELAEQFEETTGHRLRLVTGSTGKLYAQIRAGAPFDVFLAADTLHPERLLDDGVGSRVQVYAIGRPVLVSADPALGDSSCIDALFAEDPATLAIANPSTAPYGRAAREWLEGLAISPRIVMGENVAQAMHFVMTGNARFGIVAESQLLVPAWETRAFPGCAEELPEDAHAPVRQAAVQLSAAGGAFFDFLAGETSRALVAGFGYA